MAGVQCLSYDEDESVEALLVAQNVDTVRAGGRWCCLGWFYAFRLFAALPSLAAACAFTASLLFSADLHGDRLALDTSCRGETLRPLMPLLFTQLPLLLLLPLLVY